MHAGFQTGLPALLSVVTKCQRTLNESIRNIVFSSVKAKVQLIHAEVPPDFAIAKIQHAQPEIQIFLAA